MEGTIYKRFTSFLILAVSLAAVFVHVGNYTAFTLSSIMFYAWHLMLGLVLIFLYNPLWDGRSPLLQVLGRAFDWTLMALTVGVSMYVIMNFDEYTYAMQNSVLSPQLYVTGVIMTVLVLEGSRRSLGSTLPVLALLAIAYAYFGRYVPGLFGHRGYSLRRIVLSVFSDRGVYGTPIGTSASNVYLFLLFAAFLAVSHADRIFQDLALAAAGRKRGGPAKMAVIASAFFGTISGSCVANVVSTGAFTIPLMKKNGYRSAFAGAVESAASTGGQIMPPIMGAAAFVMADITGISYADICLAALLPSLMYYICLFKMVDLEAVRYGLRGLPEDRIPSFRQASAGGLKLFMPVAVLLVLLIGLKATPMKAAIWSTAAVTALGALDRRERLTFRGLLDGTLAAGRALCPVVGACSCAGIIVAVFSMTGLGLKFGSFIVGLGHSSLIPSLVLSMFVCAILGMGLPTTAAYIVCATAIAPALTGLGVPVLGTHLFLLYFASLSAITPPVAVASYAAAGIAGENPIRVGLTAVKLGLTGFILPFAFVFNSDYLTFSATARTVMTWISGFVIAYSLAVSLQGYVEGRIRAVGRALYLACAALVITSDLRLTTAGIVMFAVLYGTGKHRNKALRTLRSAISSLRP